MPWIRKGDALEGIDSTCPESQPLGFCRVKNEISITGENDATIGFLHDLEELINKHFADGGLAALGIDGLEEQNVTVLGDDVTELVSLFGDVDGRVHLEITTVLGVGSAKRDDPARVKETLRRFVNRRQVFVADSESKTSTDTDMQDTHDRNTPTDQSRGRSK